MNTITAVSGPPSIAPAGQPQSTNAVAGGSASFTVTVSGSPQFTYQWRKGGVNYGAVTVSSSITNRLTLSSLTTNNAGSYDVVVTNSFGSVTSSLATLTVSIPPAITLQPSGQSLCGSGGASFTAAASGFPTPSVQWQVSTNNGAAWANIAGATSTTYSFSAASGDSGKRYRAVFTNTGGTATSAAVTLAVNSPPAPVNTTATATRDRTLIIDIAALLGLSSAPDGDAFYLSAVGPLSTNGTPVAITATNTISYQPASGFTGADRFNYTITDILGCSASAEVGITVNP